jgi:small GTP-binding protein
LPAQKGEAKEIILYYCIPNDVAIVGLPNCGKTSLFNKFTAKSYKVADYPFTTKTCVWAPVEVDFKKITFMDTPAIKNQPKAPYAENNFLRHLLRSKIIIMVSDNPGGFNDEFRLLKKEISAFDKKLLKGKKILYILNKVDKIDKSSLDLKGIIVVSTIDGTGIEALKKKIIKRLKSSYQFSAVSSQQLIAES